MMAAIGRMRLNGRHMRVMTAGLMAPSLGTFWAFGVVFKLVVVASATLVYDREW